MLAVLDTPDRRLVDTRDDSELAATVLLVDGDRLVWRASGLQDDPDVTAWVAGALTLEHPDYRSLFWRELLEMRASHN